MGLKIRMSREENEKKDLVKLVKCQSSKGPNNHMAQLPGWTHGETEAQGVNSLYLW